MFVLVIRNKWGKLKFGIVVKILNNFLEYFSNTSQKVFKLLL